MFPFLATVAGPVLSMDRSFLVTVVVTEELSSIGVSEGGPRAVLVTVPVAIALTVMTLEMALAAPGWMVPTLQMTFLAMLSKAHGASTLWNWKRLGITSVQVALAIGTFPVLVSVTL